MNTMNPRVDEYIDNADKWREEFKELRKIVLDCGLSEELKWGKPCYAFENNNIVIMQGFKEYCALLFIKGALLKDTKDILIQQTENTQAARQVRFTNVKEIIENRSMLKTYINEAVEVEKAGLKVDYKKTSEYEIPEELQDKFNENTSLKTAFTSLTPGRQRAYLLYFSGAKQAKTRVSRIEKYIPRILDGEGLND